MFKDHSTTKDVLCFQNGGTHCEVTIHQLYRVRLSPDCSQKPSVWACGHRDRPQHWCLQTSGQWASLQGEWLTLRLVVGGGGGEGYGGQGADSSFLSSFCTCGILACAQTHTCTGTHACTHRAQTHTKSWTQNEVLSDVITCAIIF